MYSFYLFLEKLNTDLLSLRVLPFDQRVMDECVKDRAETLAVVAESLHGDLAGDPEWTFYAGDAEAIDNILGESERHAFWGLQCLALYLPVSLTTPPDDSYKDYLLEQTIEVYMDCVAGACVQKDVLAMPVPETTICVR